MRKFIKKMRLIMAIGLAALTELLNTTTSYAHHIGAERSLPNTGDSFALFVWLLLLLIALGGIIVAIIMLLHNKKK